MNDGANAEDLQRRDSLTGREALARERWWRQVAALETVVPRRKRDGSIAALPAVARAAAACTACELYREASQTVFGEGPAAASMVLVGEQPGDQEDVVGRPFVGPAGVVLDRALRAARIDRAGVYLTNAVKHFNFVLGRGKRRIHDKPRNRHVLACRGWLHAEIVRVAPKVVVCLGATASLALLGPAFRLTRWSGQTVEGPEGLAVVATVHPSALLRAPDRIRRESLWQDLVRDLKRAHALSKSIDGGRSRS